MAEPLFFVYPDGYGTEKKIPVYKEGDLQAIADKYPSACISSTAAYEQKMSDKATEMSKRWSNLWKQ